MAVLGGVEEHVVAAFRHGRGVPYSAYSRFHEVMAEESAQTVVAGLLDQILPLHAGNGNATGARHRRARRRLR